MNKLLKSVLKAAIVLIDQSSDEAARISERISQPVSERVSDLSERGRQVIYGEDHKVARALSFAAGVGVGIGAAILLAPASGAETRDAIRGTVHEVGEKVREQFRSSAFQPTGTGTP